MCFRSTLSIGLLTVLLVACGGGGSGKNASSGSSVFSSTSSSVSSSASSTISSSLASTTSSSSSNAPPVADAGADKAANPNTTVTLDATASHDPDGSIIRYEWQQLSGPAVEIIRATSAMAEFVPTENGVYLFQVTVRDNNSEETSATTTITVASDNLLPIIVIHPDIAQHNEMELVNLSVASVVDPDGYIVSYLWTLNPQSNIEVELLNADSLEASFMAPQLSESTYVYVNLTVTDNEGGQTTSPLIIINLMPVVVSPTANAGNTLVVSYGANVALDASGSSDPDGWIESYLWSQIWGQPVDLTGADTALATFIAPDTEGLYVFELTVTDNHGNTDSDVVQIDVSSRLGLKTQRRANPGRLQLVWNQNIEADQFNLYFAKGVSVDSETFATEPSAVTVQDIQSPFELDATFNEYRNTHFTLEAVVNGEIIQVDTVITEVHDIALNSANEDAGCILEGKSVNCWGLISVELESKRLINPRKLAVGTNHACALDDAGVFCWGDNTWGQTNVPSLSNPHFISAGASKSCAVDDNGVHCWGFGISNLPLVDNPTAAFDSCVMNTQGVYCNNQIAAAPPLNAPTQLSITGGPLLFACALDADGVTCWGYNGDGQASAPELQSPSAVSAGFNHACALDATGVVCWGGNEYQQTQVPTLSNPTVVVAGYRTSCALDDTGLVCWGNIYDATPPTLGPIDQVALGAESICAYSGSTLHCWAGPMAELSPVEDVLDFALGGLNLCALRPNGLQCNASLSAIPEFNNPQQVTVGSGFACALDDDGLQCWGPQSLAVSVNYPDLADIRELHAGTQHACVRTDTEVACWGFQYSSLLTVPEVSSPTALSSSGTFACMIDADEVKCWGGNNSFGETSPPSLSDPTQIATGNYHACALTNDGVTCWGGSIGGAAGETHVPVLYNPTQVAAGAASSCALDDTGLVCWGYSAFNGFGWRANPRY